MAEEGRRLLIHLVGLLWAATLTSCFNLEPNMTHLYNYPFKGTQGREPYFGFSVALQHSNDNTSWVLVGAPRANSSHHDAQEIPEPGALFKCALTSDTCDEMPVDKKGNIKEGEGDRRNKYQVLKNHGWLGGSLDSQPDYQSNRQATCVCAPLWKSQSRLLNMPGACYFAYDSISNTPDFTKELPFGGRPNTNEYGQAGFSVHFPDDSTKLIVGAPGAFKWNGSVILYEDSKHSTGTSERKKRQVVDQDDMFLDFTVSETDRTEQNGLLGYSVTSGTFLHRNETHYAAGAPQGANSHGMVIIFEFPTSDHSELLVKRELKGYQMGEYFGAALTTADINGDKLDDLIVGSPMYSFYSHNQDIPDIGRVQSFLSKEGTGPDTPENHYGRRVSFARFGTSLASLGDLNADGYEDIAVGAPWEDSGAVYIFLGSHSGLKHQYSQRLSPEDFTADLRGFGMSISRGTDTDNNGYPDLAIGNFISGHVLVVKSRPVASLSGRVTSSPTSVAWEGETLISLKTCLKYRGYRVPRNIAVQARLILDYGSITPRAFFPDTNTTTHSFVENLLFGKDKCRDHHVTVKEEKIDPDQHITMRLEYELKDTPHLQLKERPLTDPAASNSTMVDVGILKECREQVCRVNMKMQAFITDSRVVIGKVNKLRVEVSNSGEPAYLPTINVTGDPYLTLTSLASHDCRSLKDDNKTSLQCSLSKTIKKGSQPYIVDVDVKVDDSHLMVKASHVKLQVNVTGEGEELEPDDNISNMTLRLAAQANLQLHGSSEDDLLLYELNDDDQMIVTNNARFNHTYVLVKKGPTSLRAVVLTINIPVSFTDGSDFLKVHTWKNKFSHPFACHLEDTPLAVDNSGSVNSGVHSSSGIQDVNAKKEGDKGTQYFNCSSTLIKCAQLICHIPEWTVDAESARVAVELEVDLNILAKHMSVKNEAILGSMATATIQSLNPYLAFIGNKTTSGEVVTHILPANLLAKGVPWWVILLAVLGGLLLVGLVAYGLHKTGFFQRKTKEELKAQRARLRSSASAGD